MKAYLLGTLSPETTERIERRYFEDAAFLEKLQLAERKLIDDYLAGRLASGEAASFEEQYLRTPALAKKVEQARMTRRPPKTGFTNRRWMSLAAALLVGVAGFAVWSIQRRPPVLNASLPAAPPPFTLLLQPGVSKSASIKQAEIRLPLPPSGLGLFLELPGVDSPIRFMVAFKRVESSGPPSLIHTESVDSRPAGVDSRQWILSLAVPAAMLTPGDYLVEAKSGSVVRETYLFRVVPAP